MFDAEATLSTIINKGHMMQYTLDDVPVCE